MLITCPGCGFQANINSQRELVRGDLLLALAAQCKEEQSILEGSSGGPVSGCSIFDNTALTALHGGAPPA